ncbi:hypothetical protein [Phenylobacterium sp.]|uniref:hypothetical protein n=1 Tax=Phenylobacterium sp. TaxID=1871053 RepID=UPI0025FFEE33|nr:hypothetical protein [Phenylobacterium sp.]
MKSSAFALAAALAAAAPALAQETDPPPPPAHDMSHMSPAEMGGEHQGMSTMSTRDASGTSWQPDASRHEGLHSALGPWMVMTHATLNLVYDTQSGPRGDDRSFVSGMVMTMATRQVGDAGKLQLRAMLSPDPLMGKRGYPLLLASGETADGVKPLIDRQHPHDLFMELSARYDRPVGPGGAFVYIGMPGEPAFGPPAFMHRLSILDSPEAPISHHWLDSTHITFGVITAGYILGDWKLEASRFKGREPDQHRWNFDSPKLDSTAIRLSWNPTYELSLQTSWAHQHSPEQLEPQDNQDRWSASAIYTRRVGDFGYWSTTAAWGRRTATHGPHLDAFALESALKPNADWTIFARAERTQNDELTTLGGHRGPIYSVAKLSVGAIRDFALSEHLAFGIGGLYSLNHVPDGLEAGYGGGDPHGAMAFVRLKLQ